MFVTGLAALAGWGMILWRLPHVRLGTKQATYTFVTLVCFTLAATFATPAVAAIVDRYAGWAALSLIIEYIFGVAAAVVWALACISLDEALNHRRWILYVAPLALLLLLAIGFTQIGSAMKAGNVAASDAGLLLAIIVNSYAFCIVAFIGAPALGHRVNLERILPVRLRLLTILATQLILGLWLAGRAVLSGLVLLGAIPRTFPFSFVNVLIAFMIVAYIGSLLPPATFERLALGVEHGRQWMALRRLRRVEIRSARLVDDDSLPMNTRDALRVPDYAVYTLVIAILDRRKSLRQAPGLQARRLALQLDQITAQSPDYNELVRQLQRIDLRS